MKTAENRRGDDAVAVANPMTRRHRREVGRIRNAGSEARVGTPAIVVRDPLSHDRATIMIRVASSARRGFTWRSTYKASCFRRNRFSAESWARLHSADDQIHEITDETQDRDDSDARSRHQHGRKILRQSPETATVARRRTGLPVSISCGNPAAQKFLRTTLVDV